MAGGAASFGARTPSGCIPLERCSALLSQTEYLDYEQGIPNFKGFPDRIVHAEEPENFPAMFSEKR